MSDHIRTALREALTADAVGIADSLLDALVPVVERLVAEGRAEGRVAAELRQPISIVVDGQHLPPGGHTLFRPRGGVS